MRMVRMTLILVAATLSVAAGKPHPNWTATVTTAPDGGHILGDPEAALQLTEYVSYTCSHCATFQKQADAPLRLAYVTPGKVSVKIHHLVRDPVDFTVAMLTNCGDAEGFFRRHNAFLQTQDRWIEKARGLTAAQRERWENPDPAARFQAVARDLDFHEMMAQFGYTHSRVNQCLADVTMAQRLAAQTESATQSGVKGTPSFALNGTLLTGTHDWRTLDEQLRARM